MTDVDATPAGSTPGRLRVVKGDPTAEELAVLAALVTAVSGAAAAPSGRVRCGGWNDPSRQHRPGLIPGPNAWRAAAW